MPMTSMKLETKMFVTKFSRVVERSICPCHCAFCRHVTNFSSMFFFMENEEALVFFLSFLCLSLVQIRGEKHRSSFSFSHFISSRAKLVQQSWRVQSSTTQRHPQAFHRRAAFVAIRHSARTSACWSVRRARSSSSATPKGIKSDLIPKRSSLLYACFSGTNTMSLRRPLRNQYSQPSHLPFLSVAEVFRLRYAARTTARPVVQSEQTRSEQTDD